MMDFLDLPKSDLVDNFIRLHTQGSPKFPKWVNGKRLEDPYSTFRDSKSKAFDWRYDIKDYDILEIQKFCVNSMDRLGYHLMNNIQEDKYDKNFVLMGEQPNELQYI